MTKQDQRCEINEAARIFAVAQAKREPLGSSWKPREEALRALVAAVVAAAKEAGHSVDSDQRGASIYHHRMAAVFIQIIDHQTLSLNSPNEPGDPTIESVLLESLPVEFDPISGAFVGTGADVYLVPNPGTPIRRRSAVAVIAEAITKLMDRQVEMKTEARRAIAR
jgi:hypothetical protein